MLKMWIRLLAAALSAIVLAGPVQAEWREARTNHFKLYIDASEDDARSFATRLERFDAALRRLYGVADNVDRHSRPVAIYALKPELFEETCGCPGVLGYYNSPVSGPQIFAVNAPKLENRMTVGDLSSQAALLHEYGHHFMYSNFPRAFPYWYVEGFAEFNANVRFLEDGSVALGYPANYRGSEMLNGNRLPLRKLVAPDVYGYGENISLVYGRAWLLTHYLTLDRRRAGQMKTYLDQLQAGATSEAAAKVAFGDFKALDQELDRYQHGTLANPLRIPPGPAPIEVTLRTLDPGEGEVIKVWMRASNGVGEGYGRPISREATRVAAKYPDDARTQFLAADAAYMADRLEEAGALVDKALALQPTMSEALALKGKILIEQGLAVRPDDHAIWIAGRTWFRRANRSAPQWADPFFRYYLSFVLADQPVTPDAAAGIKRAAVLAPENVGIAIAVARQGIAEGDLSLARNSLIILAARPHARGKNEPADILALIDQNKLAEATSAIDAYQRRTLGVK